MKPHILYEDNHLIAVEKPAGILVQGDKSGHSTLFDAVKAYLKETYRKPGNVFLGLLHRLDRPTSGIILFAKTSKGAARLSEQFRNRSIQKTYTALVEGIPNPPQAVLHHFLLKDGAANKTRVFTRPTPGAKEATLSYRTLSRAGTATLLEIKLLTGRSHQIRAQLSFAGHPIVGDKKYGSTHLLPDHAIALQATTLTFKQATGDEIHTLTLPTSTWTL